MNSSQQKHLSERLREAACKANAAFKEDEKPAWYRTYKTRIATWDRAQEAARERHRVRIAAARKAAWEAVLFKSPQDALSAVAKFEQQRF